MHHLLIALNRKRFLIGCLLILFALNLGNAVSVYLIFVQKMDFGFGVVPLFNFDRESNFPTLFNGLILGFGSLIAFGISSWLRENGGVALDKRAWFGIGCILGFMMLDELCQIHEALDWILMAHLKSNGAIAWPWVVPYAALALGVAGFLLKFYIRLERRFQVIFAVSAIIYVIGALGFEMLEAAYTEKNGIDSIGFGVLYSIEESLEMLAVMLANWGIMTYAADRCAGLDVQLKIQ